MKQLCKKMHFWINESTYSVGFFSIYFEPHFIVVPNGGGGGDTPTLDIVFVYRAPLGMHN